MSLLNQAALGSKYAKKAKGFKVLYPIALRDAKITSLDTFVKKCQNQFFVESCGDVFSSCTSGKTDSGMIVVEYTNDNTTTYFETTTLMNDLKVHYKYFDNPTETLYKARMECLKDGNTWCCQDMCIKK